MKRSGDQRANFADCRSAAHPRCQPWCGSRQAITLVELLITVTVLAILAAAALPLFDASLNEQLIGAAQVVQAELSYARNLAVTNGSSYSVTFDRQNNRAVLTHSGTDAAFDSLPNSPYLLPGDSPKQQVIDFDELPAVSHRVVLVMAQKQSTTTTNVPDVTFGPLGETTRAETTLVWLGCGTGGARRYVAVSIDPVTGLGAIGEITTTAPVGSP